MEIADMELQTKLTLAQQVTEAAGAAGLTVGAVETGTDFQGEPTTKFTLGLGEQSTMLELSAGFELDNEALQTGLAAYMAATATRLTNPAPDVYLTLHGLPLRFGRFAWPFHTSTSGADTRLVHGEVKLEDGHNSDLHAKIAASVTLTFAAALPALEQPFAEGCIYNAVRKVMDQGQLELVKSGNRQPVVVTTRYYSAKRKRFIFNDTNEAQRAAYLAAKVFWLSGVLGESKPVWVADLRDAQYLNTTVEELARTASALAEQGIIRLDGERARPTSGLMERRAEYGAQLERALEFTRPKFNENMRQGHTNM
jgi:hypothetical protein